MAKTYLEASASMDIRTSSARTLYPTPRNKNVVEGLREDHDRKQKPGPCEMPQWVKVLATKSGSLSSIPGTHTVKEEKQLLQVIL